MSAVRASGPGLSLRNSLLTASLLAFVFIAIAGVALTARVVPNATTIARRGATARLDYASRTRLASQLDSALTDLWSQLRRARVAPLRPESTAVRRERLERIVRSSGLLEPIGRQGETSPQFRSGLELADRATSNLAASLLGVVAALELHDVPAAEEMLSRSDSLDAPLTARLNEVTEAALADLASDEARLESDARFASTVVVAWLALGLVAAPFIWLFLRRRLFQPLATIDRALHRIEGGDLDVVVPVRIRDELGRLGEHFNRTTQVLRAQRAAGERAAAQAALEASEARYRTAFEQAAVGLAELGLDGSYLRINRAMCEVLGRDVSDIIGHNFREFTHPEDGTQDASAWSRLVRDGAETVRVEKRYIRGDGSVATAQVTATLVRHAEGTPRHVLSVIQDVTEQRRLEAELLQSMKLEAVGQLAGGVAHDFNNLLAGIIGYAELLEHDAAQSEEVREDAAAIRRAAMRGADLSRSLLTLARRTPQRQETFALEPVLRETADLMRRTIDRRIEVQLAVEGGLSITGDRSLVANALLNLALNARDAMPEGGVLRVEAQSAHPDATTRERLALARDGAFVSIAVRDTGCGMSREVVDRVFEPFFTTKEPGKGTGLGLSMVYGTVRGHDGAITVDSEPGRGTQFTILLPRAVESAAMTPQARVPVAAGQAARVLVVDDDPFVRDAAARMLIRLGYEVEMDGDGAAALERLARQDHGVQVVILDGNMPRLSGIETARRVHARHPQLPMVYASGYFDPALEEDFESLGFRDRLVKPYTMEAMSRAVARCLGRTT